MSSLLSFAQQFGARCLNVDVFVSLVALVFVYFFVVRSDALYEFVGKILVKLELKVTGHYDHVPADGESVVSAHKTRASWEYKKDNVGVYAIQGRRPHMEDRFNVVSELEHTGTSIYGVFDGHGGEFAADYTEKTLFKIIMVRLLKAALAAERLDLSTLLTEEILNVDKQLLVIERSTGEISGTTALVALLRDNQLYVANVGDSRAVMCDHDGNTLPLSFDHKPQSVKERRRIKKAGGFISFNGVWRVAGILATSRALGDYPLKENSFVIADPDVLTFDLDKIRPRFMIIASDGLWDAFSNEEAVNYIKDRLDEPHFGAKSIVLQAYYRGSLDNVTVMIVNFMLGTVIETSTEELMTTADEIVVGSSYVDEETIAEKKDDAYEALEDSVIPVIQAASSSEPCDHDSSTTPNEALTSNESGVSFSLHDVESSNENGTVSFSASDEAVSHSREDVLSMAHERRILAFRCEQVVPLSEENIERALEDVVASLREDEAIPTCVETVFRVASSRENNVSSLCEDVISPITAEKVAVSYDIGVAKSLGVDTLKSPGTDEENTWEENILHVRQIEISPSCETFTPQLREESASLTRKESAPLTLEKSASVSQNESMSPATEESVSITRQTDLSSSSEEGATSTGDKNVSLTRERNESPQLEESAYVQENISSEDAVKDTADRLLSSSRERSLSP